MADDIRKADDIPAVESTTEATPHPADESSAPGPYEGLDVNRPPVSTNQATTPIAQSLVAGAGAPSPEPSGPPPEEQTPAPAEPEADEKRGPGRPKKEDS
jgi:hypothetical protein